MMSIREFFSNLYMNCKMDEDMFEQVSDLENQVFDWYNDDDDKFYEFVKINNIDLDVVSVMMNGSDEYDLTLWVWDMED